MARLDADFGEKGLVLLEQVENICLLQCLHKVQKLEHFTGKRDVLRDPESSIDRPVFVP